MPHLPTKQSSNAGLCVLSSVVADNIGSAYTCRRHGKVSFVVLCRLVAAAAATWVADPCDISLFTGPRDGRGGSFTFVAAQVVIFVSPFGRFLPLVGTPAVAASTHVVSVQRLLEHIPSFRIAPQAARGCACARTTGGRPVGVSWRVVAYDYSGTLGK